MNESAKERLLKSAPAPYIPKKLPLNTFSFVTKEIFELTVKANNAVGQYAGFLKNTPNPWLLLAPITTQEAVLSSKLEGTHATLEDILNHEAGNQTSIETDEIKEVQNYSRALVYAMENISCYDDLSSMDSKSPLTVKLLKEMHAILLDNVRGSTKHPGKFKMLQNYIGGAENISFTPLPPELVNEYMSNLERYMHYQESDLLLQAAILHAQFEMIHPFEDGNGRIGRLLIPLFLYYRGLIPLPTFYMSSYFERNRDIYIQRLSDISKNGDWNKWIEYFLNGVILQAGINTIKAGNILNLYNKFKEQADKIKSLYFIQILDFIFEHPIFTVKQLQDSKHINASKQTLYNVLQKMEQAQLLQSSDTVKNKTFICNKLLSTINQ